MPPRVSRGAPRLRARRGGVARPPCLGGPTPFPAWRALRRSSGRRAGVRRGSPRPLASSTSLPDVSSSLPDVLSSLPGVSSTPSCEPKAALVVHSVLAGQPLRPRARCVCIRYSARRVGQQRSRLGPLARRMGCFFGVGAASKQNGGFAAAACPPGVGLGLVWRDRRLVES